MRSASRPWPRRVRSLRGGPVPAVDGAFARYQSADKSASSAPDFLSSHPSTPERLQIAVRSARQIGAPGIGERDRERYLSQIDGMLFGDDPLEGFVRGRSFLHKALGIGFHGAHGLYSGKHTGGRSCQQWRRHGDPLRRRGCQRLFKPADYMKSGWINGLLPESVRETTINGLPAVTGAAITQGWSFRIAVVRIGRTGYRFIFASRSPNHQGFDDDFRETVDSFRQLTPTESGPASIAAYQGDQDQARRHAAQAGNRDERRGTVAAARILLDPQRSQPNKAIPDGNGGQAGGGLR